MAGGGTLTHIALGSLGHGHGLLRSAAVSLGVIAGAQVGARISLRVRAAVIQVLLAGALLALGPAADRVLTAGRVQVKMICPLAAFS